MIMHSDKKVICVKDIPSNIIEEAIFILKENISQNQDEENDERSKEIILNEAEEIVEEYINKMQYEDEDELVEDGQENNGLKKEILYIAGLLIILAICISSVI
ncbi:MAG: hypothetical protein IJ220_03510 [Clostridia bacterium]|nr:hypothetical protein [Clostridia bacterium]